MAQVFVVAIAALNALAVYFLSFLATDGFGSSAGVIAVRWIGFGATAIATALALFLCERGARTSGILTAVGTLPVTWVMSFFALSAVEIFKAVVPAPSAFTAACKDVGARYLKTPDRPVLSMAFDWKKDDAPPRYSYFQVASNGRLSDLGGGNLSFLPAQIEFIESRCCRFFGQPTKGKGLPYVRMPNSQVPYYGVSELSADALVTFSSAPVKLQGSDLNLTAHEFLVTDKRTGDTLATLKYLVDRRWSLGCGTTSAGVLDERAFFLRAVGVQEECNPAKASCSKR